MPKRLRAALPYLILAVLLLVIFHELAFTDFILGRGDTFTYFYPYWTVRDRFFRAGELPLWTPDIFMGAPLLANPQIGALYPPNWLTIWLNAPDAIRISILLHLAWATVGAYLLARRAANLHVSAALVTATLFGLGGYVGAHVEQINQLQGLAWFPWLFLLLHGCLFPTLAAASAPSAGATHESPTHTSPQRHARMTLLLGIAIALQILSGHTQTVFIGGVGMLLYGLASLKPLRTLVTLVIAGGIALLLASPQLIPTFELVGQSSRSGGLDAPAALSFSLNPFIAARGLLPSYDGKVFTEYIAYVGVLGMVLAGVGIMNTIGAGATHEPPAHPRNDNNYRMRLLPWLVLALVGLFLAVGAYNPANWLIVQLPGFDLFRVPARWLALYGLGMAVLAGMGTQALLRPTLKSPPRKQGADFDLQRTPSLRVARGLGGEVAILILTVLALMGAAFLAGRVPEEVTGSAVPTRATLLGWGVALVAAVVLIAAPSRWRVLVVPLVFAELIAASWVMPYNDLVPPEVWSAQRFTISQMLAYTETDENGLSADGTPPGRVLSISGLLFDPGDKAALSARYQALGMTPLEERYSFVAAKMKETLSPNLPLAWGIPSVDGYDGGLLPTKHYNTFMQLIYPDGVDVPGDGRLRENLALEACRGACVPEMYNLDTDFVLIDKVYDIWYEGVAFDTSSSTRGYAEWLISNFSVDPFRSNEVQFLFSCEIDLEQCFESVESIITIPCCELAQRSRGTITMSQPVEIEPNLWWMSRTSTLYYPNEAAWSQLDGYILHAISLVDEQTGNFVQLTPGFLWDRRLSSDVKLYRMYPYPNGRSYVTNRFVQSENDQESLEIITSDTLRPYTTLARAEASADESVRLDGEKTFTSYHPTRVELEVNLNSDAVVVLNDSYYPGWRATVNGEPKPVYRANINFRAVPLPAGESHVIFNYDPWWLPGVFIVGVLAWAFVGITLLSTIGRTHS